jgi:hypothetical protein
MTDANNNNDENVGEDQPLIGAVQSLDEQLASITEWGDPNCREYVLEPPIDIPSMSSGAQMEMVMAALVNAINRQGQYT